MTDLIKQITSDFQKQIEAFKPEVSVSDIGTVVEAGDGIARVKGLASIRSQELVQFANGVIGIAFNLEQSSVGVIIMGEYSEIAEGMTRILPKTRNQIQPKLGIQKRESASAPVGISRQAHACMRRKARLSDRHR